MKRKPILRTILLFFILLLVSMAAQVTLAQSGNLLTNPGFEQPFEPVAGHAPSMVAQGWTPWFSTTEPNTTPEYYPATDTSNGMSTPRIHGGSDAQQYFTFFAAHDGGLYQHVGGLTAGDQLTFSVYAYIWASSGDDANVSDGNGNLSVQVGIDPNGGTDATSSAIVWSNPLAFVDKYVQHSVSATAFGDSITVFVRSSVTKVAMNNVVYLDDAELTVTGTGGAVPAVTAQATEAVAEVPTSEGTVAIDMTAVMATAEITAELPVATEATVAVVEATALPTEVPPTKAPPTEVPPTEIPATAAPPTEVPPTEIPATAAPTIPPTPSPTLDTTVFPYMVEYTVVRGDTVGNLATRFGSTVTAIIIANGLSADARIFETQKLMIPVTALPTPTIPATAVPATQIPATPVPATAAPATPVPSETPVVVQPAASETPIVVQPANPQGAAQEATTYVVQYGDSLSSIAAHFGISTRSLARANNISNPNLIVIGQVLKVPVPGSQPPPAPAPTSGVTTAPPTSVPAGHLYVVMRGDSLYRIAQHFNVSLDALIQVNGIKDASHIFVGQTLIIP